MTQGPSSDRPKRDTTKPKGDIQPSLFGQFAGFDGEMWLAKRLEQHGYHVFLGDTDRPERCRRLRAAIIDTGREQVIAGRAANGKGETYAAAFERLYGEPLVVKSKRARAGASGL